MIKLLSETNPVSLSERRGYNEEQRIHQMQTMKDLSMPLMHRVFLRTMRMLLQHPMEKQRQWKNVLRNKA